MIRALAALTLACVAVPAVPAQAAPVARGGWVVRDAPDRVAAQPRPVRVVSASPAPAVRVVSASPVVRRARAAPVRKTQQTQAKPKVVSAPPVPAAPVVALAPEEADMLALMEAQPPANPLDSVCPPTNTQVAAGVSPFALDIGCDGTIDTP